MIWRFFPGKRLLSCLLILCVMILFHFTVYVLITSFRNLVWGNNDELGIENDEFLMRQEDYLMRQRLEEEELRHLGRLDLLKMEMEVIDNTKGSIDVLGRCPILVARCP